MSAGFVLSQIAFQLPILALLIIGLVLVGTRSAQIGPRSVLFARLGLGLLILNTVFSVGWSFALQQLARSVGSASQLGQVSLVYGLATTAMYTAAVGLLIAAIVARPSGAPGHAGPPGAAYAAGGPYAAPGSAMPQQGPFRAP